MSVFLPVRMRWKDNSTLLESKAEVSMKDKPFSAKQIFMNSRGEREVSTHFHWCESLSCRSSKKTLVLFHLLTSKCLGLISGDSAQVTQIALVTDEHDHNVGVSMVAELFEPAADVFIGLVLGNVVDKQSTDGATIVCRSNGAVTLLSSYCRSKREEEMAKDC